MTDLPPRFKVGQTVLLTSQVAPQLNGVHIVRFINAYPDAIVDRTNQKFEGYSYELQGIPGDWAEHCLRGGQLMGLNMMGHVSGPFATHTVALRRYATKIVNFKPVLALDYDDSFLANIQQASDKEIEFLGIGGERVNDVRVVHRNDGKGIRVSTPDNLADVLIFSDGINDDIWWKSINTDYRPWHNFCRATVVKLDPSEIQNLINKGA